MYKAYFGPRGCGMPGPLEKERWPSKSFAELAEALTWAEGVAKHGTTVVAIDGDNGTRLSRADIALWLGRSATSG